MAEIVKDYYKNGWYTKENVKTFVEAGWITKDDYKNITGEDYKA